MTLLIIKETVMAYELTRYAKAHGYTEQQTEDLIALAAKHAIDERGEDWWVTQALQDDGHKHFDLISSFDWSETEEGDEYWRTIYRFVDRLPEEVDDEGEGDIAYLE